MHDHQLNDDTTFKNQQVKNKVASYPPPIRKKLLFIRQLIFETAGHLKEVGQLLANSVLFNEAMR